MVQLPKDSLADIAPKSNKTYIEIRQERRRISWTRFHLSHDQDWPRWTTVGDSNSDDTTFLGPLAAVEGCEKVWLGRQVEDFEKAALIVRTYRGPIIQAPRPYGTGTSLPIFR